MFVVKPWLQNLTFKEQTVLLSAIRGCDGVGKDDISKKFVRLLRNEILEDACPQDQAQTFMKDSLSGSEVNYFLKSMDHYPMHWLFHFLHAVEILGYFHPEKEISQWWKKLYFGMVDALHLQPESLGQIILRLSDGKPSNCWKS